MRVISQDGTIDVPYEMVVIQRFRNAIYFLNRNLTGVEGLINDIALAEYSTKEKAIKAMEMLREQYKRLETLKLYTKGSREDIREILTLDELGYTILKTRKLSVFQFPQDNEIEV
jgi:hypothetical protein